MPNEREELIKELQDKNVNGSNTDIADFILAREKSLAKEIVKPLNIWEGCENMAQLQKIILKSRSIASKIINGG